MSQNFINFKENEIEKVIPFDIITQIMITPAYYHVGIAKEHYTEVFLIDIRYNPLFIENYKDWQKNNSHLKSCEITDIRKRNNTKTEVNHTCYICDCDGATIRMSPDSEKYAHEYCLLVFKTLQPGQILVVDWKVENGIIIKNPSRLSK